MKTAEDARKELTIALAQREATKRAELNRFIKDKMDFFKRNFTDEYIEKCIRSCIEDCRSMRIWSSLHKDALNMYYDAPGKAECKEYFGNRILEAFDEYNNIYKNMQKQLISLGYNVDLGYTSLTFEGIKKEIVDTMKVRW